MTGLIHCHDKRDLLDLRTSELRQSVTNKYLTIILAMKHDGSTLHQEYALVSHIQHASGNVMT